MAKKTTAAERKAFIEEQRAKPQGYGARAVFPRDMSFIDREGNIVRPNKEDYQAAIAKRDRYNTSRGGADYQATQESGRYHGREKQRRGYQAVIATLGLLGAIFFLSSNITGNAIANVSQSSGNILGAILLVVGLVAGFFWVKKK